MKHITATGYTIIANAINQRMKLFDNYKYEQGIVENTAKRISYELKKDNPRFNEKKFMDLVKN